MYLLLLISFLVWCPACSAMWGPKVVSAPVGSSLTVPCHYDPGWETYYKWWCRGADWGSCKILVKTNGSEEEVKDGLVSIKDNHTTQIFTMTMENITEDDADFYWCGIERSVTDLGVQIKVSIDPDPEFDPINLKVESQRGKLSAVTVNCQPPLEDNRNITALTSVPMISTTIFQGDNLHAILLNCKPTLMISGEITDSNSANMDLRDISREGEQRIVFGSCQPPLEDVEKIADPDSVSMYLTVIYRKGKPRALIVSCKPPLQARWKTFAPTCVPRDFRLIYQESKPHTLTVNCQLPKEPNEKITALTSVTMDFTVFTHTPDVKPRSVFMTRQPSPETTGKTTEYHYPGWPGNYGTTTTLWLSNCLPCSLYGEWITHGYTGRTTCCIFKEDNSRKTQTSVDCWRNVGRARAWKQLNNIWNHGTTKDIAQRATQLLQEVVMTTWNEIFASPGKHENPELGIVYETNRCNETSKEIILEAVNNTMGIDCTRTSKESTKGQRDVALIVYQTLGDIINGSFFSDRKGHQNVKLNSFVVSGTNDSEKKIYLYKPVLLTLKHIQPVGARTQLLCASWEGSKEGGSWSVKDCSYIGSNDTHTKCQCSHLPAFAVLMALKHKVDPGLAVITCMGLSLSMLCLLLAAVTFLLCRSIQNTSTWLHLQLSICLFLAHLLFLVGFDKTEPEILCSVIAETLHYLCLASFTWVLLEGLHLFFTLRNFKVANYTSTGRFKNSFMYPFGYGIPAVIVAASAGMGHKNYATNTHCWLKLEKVFMEPVVIIILINVVLHFIILWILKSKLSSHYREVSTIQKIRVMTFKAIAQLFILICSWSLGFFTVEAVGKTAELIIAYIFIIINVLQGVLLFVVHCLLNQQVQMEYRKWLSSLWKGVEVESTELSHSTTHTQMEEPGKSSEFVPEKDTENIAFAQL